MTSLYPLPVFHFQVMWGGANLGFSEVSGLTIETQVIEYRNGLMPEFGTTKQPGLLKNPNIIMKRGIVRGDNQMFDWLNATKMNKPERRDLIISLLNEDHIPVMTWKAKNAWPVKLEGPALKASGNEVAIESLEVAHEGLTIENV
jgi:phage tail-like protein